MSRTRKMLSEEEILRKRLAFASAVLVSMSVAGCGGGLVGGEEQSPAESNNSSAPAPTSEAKESERTAPAKSLELADKCSIVPEDQARSFGADQPPEVADFNGAAGCDYDQGPSAAGFTVFVGAKKDETMQEYAEMRKSSVEPTEVGGYPAVEGAPTDDNCYISVDVSDQGSVFVAAQPLDAPDEPCELAKKFAEAAVKNLPDA